MVRPAASTTRCLAGVVVPTFGVLLGQLPLLALVSLLAVPSLVSPLRVAASRHRQGRGLAPLLPLTARLHLALGVLLAAALLAAALLPHAVGMAHLRQWAPGRGRRHPGRAWYYDRRWRAAASPSRWRSASPVLGVTARSRLADRGRRRVGGVVPPPQLEPRGERDRVPGGAGGGRPALPRAAARRPSRSTPWSRGCPRTSPPGWRWPRAAPP